MLVSLLEAWDDRAGLILPTSDHGNLEGLITHERMPNLVPTLVVGAPELRRDFIQTMEDLMHIAPAILSTANGPVRH